MRAFFFEQGLGPLYRISIIRNPKKNIGKHLGFNVLYEDYEGPTLSPVDSRNKRAIGLPPSDMNKYQILRTTS